MEPKQKKWLIAGGVAIGILLLALAVYVLVGKEGAIFSAANKDYTGKKVSVLYVGTFPDGKMFDTNIEDVAKKNGLHQEGRPYTPLQFVVGSGQVVAGFENAINGMRIGDTKDIVLQPKEAYGDYEEGKKATLPLSLFEEAGVIPQTGQTYQVGGQAVQAVAVTSAGVVVDANHQMAGKTLHFAITLLSAE